MADNQYSVTHEGEGLEHVAILRNAETGSEARVAVGYGFNVFSFKVPCNEALTEHANILYAEPGFPRADLRATGNGTPILVPFPNRIAGGTFTYEGKTYTLPCNDHGVNAIHGFAFDRPWRIVEESAEYDATLVGEFELLRDSPFTLEHWPGNFRVRCEINFHSLHLVQRFTVTNLADVPIPFGLGTHPYYRLSGDGVGDLNHSGVIVDAGLLVELRKTIPTGRTSPVTAETRLLLEVQDVPGHEGVKGQAPVSIGNRHLDDLYTNLRASEDSEKDLRQFKHFVFDKRGPTTIFTAISHNADFPYVVVYVPPHRGAVCIEPYTCVTNAVNIGTRLGPDGPPTGLWHLQPGGERSTTISTFAAAYPYPEQSSQ